jgi:hypothetical protein
MLALISQGNTKLHLECVTSESSRLPDRISINERDSHRQNLCSALNELAAIVQPGTLRLWGREAAAKPGIAKKEKLATPGPLPTHF